MGAGYALMTGGRPLGRAHLYSYLPHSVDAARLALVRDLPGPCRRLAALRPRQWLGPQPGPHRGRARRDHDYESRASFDFARDGATWHMQLLRPRPSVAVKLAC